MLTESFSGELGGDSECPCCGKKRKLFWWLSFGTCVTGLLFSDVWRWIHVQTLLCVSLQSRSDRKEKKRRSKKHSTETWSGTKSHRSSSASRMPEPCRRHENSGSIQREPFLLWHQVCTDIKWDCFLPLHNWQKEKKTKWKQEKAFYCFPKHQLLSSLNFPPVAETMVTLAFWIVALFSQEESFLLWMQEAINAWKKMPRVAPSSSSPFIFYHLNWRSVPVTLTLKPRKMWITANKTNRCRTWAKSLHKQNCLQAIVYFSCQSVCTKYQFIRTKY